MMTDDKFLDKANKFHILQDASDNSFYTLEEYKLATETLQRNKEGKFSNSLYHFIPPIQCNKMPTYNKPLQKVIKW